MYVKSTTAASFKTGLGGEKGSETARKSLITRGEYPVAAESTP
jgi:hypothetical protein